MNTENHCFCELAPLYVLDLLSEPEKRWFEQQLAQSSELVEELAQYEIAVTAIPYSTPIIPMAANLKAQLFANLTLEDWESPTDQNVLPENILPPKMAVRYQDIQWQPHTVPGVEISIFHTDLIKREIVGVLRADPGVHYPLHRHAATEKIYMLEGDLVIGDEVYGAFDYIYSEPGSSHTPYTRGGCMFFFHTSIDDEYPDSVASLSKGK